MIQYLFFPERINSYYLFSKRVAAFDITLTEIYVTVTLLKGKTRIIEKLFNEPLETDASLSLDERVIKALTAIATKLPSVDMIETTLHSSQVVYKELSLPFAGAKKIKMVVPFEVESLLPFTLDSGTIDSIITKEDKNSTDVLVAAVKNEQIAQIQRLFTTAGLPLKRITVDMLELYGLYELVTPHTTQSLALVDLGYHTTRVAVIIEGQLRYIRSLPKGLVSIAKKIAALNHVDPSENLNHLMRFGLQEISDEAFSTQAQGSAEELMSEIVFTIQTFTQKLQPPVSLQKMLIAGPAADIPHIAQYITDKTSFTASLFQPKNVVHNSIVQSKVTTLPNSFIISIATALAPTRTQDYNLLKEEVEKEQDTLLNRQLLAVAVLAGVLFLSFLLYSFLRVRNLRLALTAAETEAIQELKKNVTLKPTQTTNLQTANKAALTELTKQETAWSRLSETNRYAYLRYLAELSRCIHLKDTQLDLATISIKDDSIKLYGSVPGYQQLTKLQNELECPLFKKLPKLQDWNFKSEPIALTVNKEEL